MRYHRVVLKLSGEFLGYGRSSLSASNLSSVCRSIEMLVSVGVEPLVVVGGGNIFRGGQHEEYGISQVDADIVGMTATGVNASLLRAMLASRKIVLPVLFGNGPCEAVGHRWMADDAKEALETGRVPIVAGGWGKPLVSTDFPSVGFAEEVDAEAVLMAKSCVDGVYDRDPRLHPTTARFMEEMSLAEALALNLEVMDRVAMQKALEHSIRIHVFSAEDPELPTRVVKGEAVGTLLFP